MLITLFLKPYQHYIDNLTQISGIQMCDMCKVKKVIERRKYKAIKKGGHYAEYKLNHK